MIVVSSFLPADSSSSVKDDIVSDIAIYFGGCKPFDNFNFW